VIKAQGGLNKKMGSGENNAGEIWEWLHQAGFTKHRETYQWEIILR
jgi:hypothetical protein